MGFLPLAMSFAIMRYQLMGIRRLVHRGVVYLLLGVVILALYAGLYSLLRVAISGPFFESATILLQLALVFGVVVAFPVALRGARRVVDTLLYHDSYDYARTLERLSAEISTYGDVSEMLAHVSEHLERALNLRSAIFVLVGSPESGVYPEATPGIEAALGVRVRNAAQEAIGGESVWQLRDFGEQVGQVLLVQLPTPAKVVGAMALDPKAPAETFRQDDIGLVVNFAGQLAAAINNRTLLGRLRTRLAEVERTAKQLVDSRIELRELNARLVVRTDEERRRISRDLHDGPTQEVAALALQLEWVDGAEDMAGLARDISRDLREFSSELRPAILDEVGLVPSLEWLADRTARRAGVEVRLDSSGFSPTLAISKEIESTLFRVTQEALSNCVNHSRAKAINVWLESGEGHIRLNVTDDGQGFAAAEFFEKQRSSNIGLVGMKDRLGFLGGWLDIRSEPGQGTEIRASVPLDQDSPMAGQASASSG